MGKILIGAVGGFILGVLTLHSLLIMRDLELWQVTAIIKQWAVPSVKLLGTIFFAGKMWAVARHPRPSREKINWENLNAKQMLVMLLRDHYAALGMLLVALVFAVSLAPDILSVSGKIPSVQIEVK